VHNAEEIKNLCIGLLKADTETEVIQLLSNADLWDDQAKWRDLGDNENNYAIIGSQQSKADAALVEKLVNSIDARLTDESIKAGIEPAGTSAPPSIRYAVAQLIEKSPHPENETNGRVANWTSRERTLPEPSRWPPRAAGAILHLR
jgi:hypothetical protein